MEIQLPSLQVLFTSFLCLLVLKHIVVKSSRKVNNSTPKLPPGPWKLPLIGNLHLLVGSHPYHILRDLARRHGPLMHLQLGQLSTVVVSSSEMAKQVMKTHDVNFANRPFLLAASIMSYNSTDIAWSPYGNYWRQLKKISTVELLTAHRVQSLRSIREEEVLRLVKDLNSCQGSPVNLTEKLFSLAYSVTSRAAFGAKCKDLEVFISTMKESNKLAGGFCLADMYPSVPVLQVITGMRGKLEKLHRVADRILQQVLEEHREMQLTGKLGNGEGKEYLVDVLLRLQKHNDSEMLLTDNNIKAVILDIFGAGSDTSASTVDWAMAEMMRNPMVMEEAQAEVRQFFNQTGKVDEKDIDELKFLKAVIKETLRLHPPVPLLLPRESSESCEVHGYDIPAKTKVIINAWALARDPHYWSEAETFKPERFLDLDTSVDYKGMNFEYIPFGAGRRMCPGISFALPNIELPLAQLLYHFDWKLANGLKQEDLDMTNAYGLGARRNEDLLLVPIPCCPIPDSM